MAANQDQAKEEAVGKEISLEDAHLQMGEPISLQVWDDGAGERYSVKLIGISQGRSVLVSAPMIDGKYLMMREGQSFIVRAFPGKSAIAFTTQILKSVNSPYPYLHLAYPRGVRSVVVRKGARANVRIICVITDCDGVQLQEAGSIVNISIGGALVAVKRAFAQKGQGLKIKFKLIVSGVQTLLELKAVIQAVNTGLVNDPEMRYQLGLQFVDVSAENSIPLLAFVYQQLIEQSMGN